MPRLMGLLMMSIIVMGKLILLIMMSRLEWMIKIKVIMIMICDQDDQEDDHDDSDDKIMRFSTTCDNHVYDIASS